MDNSNDDLVDQIQELVTKLLLTDLMSEAAKFRLLDELHVLATTKPKAEEVIP